MRVKVGMRVGVSVMVMMRIGVNNVRVRFRVGSRGDLQVEVLVALARATDGPNDPLQGVTEHPAPHQRQEDSVSTPCLWSG